MVQAAVSQHGDQFSWGSLRCATAQRGEFVRSDLGALVPGRLADVLVVDGDPLDDISILEERARLKLIMKAGAAYTNRL